MLNIFIWTWVHPFPYPDLWSARRVSAFLCAIALVCNTRHFRLKLAIGSAALGPFAMDLFVCSCVILCEHKPHIYTHIEAAKSDDEAVLYGNIKVCCHVCMWWFILELCNIYSLYERREEKTRKKNNNRVYILLIQKRCAQDIKSPERLLDSFLILLSVCLYVFFILHQQCVYEYVCVYVYFVHCTHSYTQNGFAPIRIPYTTARASCGHTSAHTLAVHSGTHNAARSMCSIRDRALCAPVVQTYIRLRTYVFVDYAGTTRYALAVFIHVVVALGICTVCKHERSNETLQRPGKDVFVCVFCMYMCICARSRSDITLDSLLKLSTVQCLA